MSSLSSRARWVAVVFAAFLGGLILASGGLNLSKLSFAQSKPDAQSVAGIQPGRPDHRVGPCHQGFG